MTLETTIIDVTIIPMSRADQRKHGYSDGGPKGKGWTWAILEVTGTAGVDYKRNLLFFGTAGRQAEAHAACDAKLAEMKSGC